MVGRSWSFAVALLPVFASCLLLVGCEPRPKDCGLVDKTEEQCRQALPDLGVFCRGVLEKVDYVVVNQGHNGQTQTLLRFRDGSSCLTDKSFVPSSVNGIPAGTSVRVVWKRLPVEKHCCFEGEFRCFKDVCDYVQTVETGNAEAVPR